MKVALKPKIAKPFKNDLYFLLVWAAIFGLDPINPTVCNYIFQALCHMQI